MKNTTNWILGIYLIFSTLCQCTSDSENAYEKIKKHATHKNIIIEHISIDTVKVNHFLCRSGDGFWKNVKDTLYYFDRELGVVDKYSPDGNFIGRNLGFGQGPGEILDEFVSACAYKDGWIVAENRYVYSFNQEFKEKSIKTLVNWEKDFAAQKERIIKNPKPSEQVEVYTPECYPPQLMHLADNKFLMKVKSSYPSLFSLQFYNESAIAAIYDFDKGSIVKLLGSYPPIFHDGYCYPAFSNPYFTPYKNGGYLLTFPIDPNIYLCNEHLEPVGSFGLLGEMNDTNYSKYSDNEELAHSEFLKELNQKGHNVSLFYDPNRDITLRVYKTGKVNNSITENNKSRMQIYKGFELIGDVAVPDNFEIFEKRGDYYLADGYINALEDGDEIGYYMFKIL